LHYFDKATGRKSKKPPQFAKRGNLEFHLTFYQANEHDVGQKIVALVETTAPVCVEKFVDYPQLGRFTLRDEGQSCISTTFFICSCSSPNIGKTIAIGKITKLIERGEEEITDGVAHISVA
jgi:peptide chain release factor subunit 3